jgi:hypothetical protein
MHIPETTHASPFLCSGFPLEKCMKEEVDAKCRMLEYLGVDE